MTAALIVAAVVLLIVLVATWRMRRGQSPDGVALFQRQIDALSPEARQRVVSEVQRIDDEKKDPPDGS